MDKDQILRFIDSATEPAKMGKPEAVDFLESLRADIDSRLEALQEEIANDEAAEDG